MSEKKRSDSTIWVKMLRFVAYACIVCGCLVSLFIGFLLILRAAPENRLLAILLGIVIIVVGSVFSMLGSASIMVYLDMASDLRAIRNKAEGR